MRRPVALIRFGKAAPRSSRPTPSGSPIGRSSATLSSSAPQFQICRHSLKTLWQVTTLSVSNYARRRPLIAASRSEASVRTSRTRCLARLRRTRHRASRVCAAYGLVIGRGTSRMVRGAESFLHPPSGATAASLQGKVPVVVPPLSTKHVMARKLRSQASLERLL